MRQNTAHYKCLFLNDVPLLDVRAPVEFSRGAFPCAENHPLLDNRQRELIGIEYSRNGQQAAIDLGWQLATREVVQAHLARWGNFVQRYPHGYLYCFRGGLRSRTTQNLLRAEGIHYPLVEGGYKAMRNYLLAELENLSKRLPIIVIAGHTGSGKTELIRNADRALDLEAIARHRGSSFGGTGHKQPVQVDFENRISIDLLKLAQNPGAVLIEDESRLIGCCALPPVLQNAMKGAPWVLVEETVEIRAKRIVRDYVQEALPHFSGTETAAAAALGEALRSSLGKLRKRLGGLRYQQLDAQLAEANCALVQSGCSKAYVPLVVALLKEYYDGQYDYLMKKRKSAPLFRGTHAEVNTWLTKSGVSLAK
ncbi:tRNA 2-selenouridine(34) synthase MnmH [Microbulbifer spongiae]|uniref:tRNA 2-selenouridine(34) synthase MnmH n=1 Tax=Microbulbifer spongiae TaxID=2944933 RepID=A0ABY9ECF6_9GAMM|nr:tRNA 2-selenouridine(34) synthase MnmH [Microbulbifer sp. MI-G]WKD50322.1 tRNA 2-selenouridine(34) synthase MnmH [Microbulbifer sp. MI-G]